MRRSPSGADRSRADCRPGFCCNRSALRPGGSASSPSNCQCGKSVAKSSISSRADLLDQRRDLRRIVGRVGRLDGQPHMVADDVEGRLGHPRHLGAHAAPGLVELPREGRQPGEARFDQHHLERRKLGEHALGDEARQLRREELRVRDVILEQERRPAASCSADGDRCCRHGCRSAARASRRRDRSASSGGGPAACRARPAPAPGRSAGRRRGARSPRRRDRGSATAPRSRRAGADRGRAIRRRSSR